MKGVKNEGRGWGIHMCINKYIYIYFFCCIYIYLYFWLYLYNCICFHVLFRRASVPRLHQRRSLGRSFCQVKQERDHPGGYINTVTVIVAHTLYIQNFFESPNIHKFCTSSICAMSHGLLFATVRTQVFNWIIRKLEKFQGQAIRVFSCQRPSEFSKLYFRFGGLVESMKGVPFWH